MKNKTIQKSVVSGQSSVVNRRRRAATDNGQRTTDGECASVRPGPWAEYLAANPEMARKQAALVEQITAKVAEFQAARLQTTSRMVNLAEAGRQIGLLVLDYEEMFAGKKLTEDFWRQVEPLFEGKIKNEKLKIEGTEIRDSCGQKITRDMLLWFARVAKKFPEPITKLEQVTLVFQPLMLASGDPEFQLQGERAGQVLHAPPNPLNLLKEQFSFTRLEETWKTLRANAHYCPGGRLREDLRETLRLELAPTFRIVDELRAELGV